MSEKINLLTNSNDQEEIAEDKKVILKKKRDNEQNFVVSEKNKKEKDTLLKKVRRFSFKGIISKFTKKQKSESSDMQSKQSEFDNSVKEDVNFITSDLIIPSSKEMYKRIIVLGLILVICIVIIFVLYIFLIVRENVIAGKMVDVTKEQKLLQYEINDFSEVEEEIINMKEKIAFISSLMDHHIYWTSFFEILEEFTISSVSYTGFDMDVSGQLRLVANAVDYNSVADQMYIFSAFPQYFNNVMVDSMSMVEGDEAETVVVKLVFSLDINPDIFYSAHK